MEVSLREYLEAWQRAHDSVHAEEEKVRDAFARRMDSRLEALNELRAEVLTDRANFVNSDVFDERMKSIDIRIAQVHDQVIEWKGRNKGLGISGQIILAILTFASTIIAIIFVFN